MTEISEHSPLPGLSGSGTPAERRALLAQRLRDRITTRGHALSYPQQRLWFLDQLDPGNPVYVVPLVYRIDGPLDVPALEHALTEVVRRHHVLRTTFRAVEGEPRQFVQPAADIAVSVCRPTGSARRRPGPRSTSKPT